MSSLRVILITIIGWLVYWLIRRMTTRIRTPDHQPDQRIRMVRCAYCDIYITEQEAISRDNAFFCTAEHHQKMINKSTE